MTRRDTRTHALDRGVTVLELRPNLYSSAGRVNVRVRKSGVVANTATVEDGRRRGETEHVLYVEDVGTHAEATRVLVVVLGPSKAQVGVVLLQVQLEQERV
eukprot:scaffold4729_cov145-Isochrysis_galbana.AAC.3